MKIAFAGAGGTGKTTTAMALVDTLSTLQRMTSASRAVYGVENLTEAIVLNMSSAEKWALQHRIFQRKIELDNSTNDFVADRTLLDHWAYCLMYCAGTMENSEFEQLKAVVQNHMRRAYDYVFYFPYGHWYADSDGVRQDSRAWQSTIDMLILSHLRKWNIPFRTVPQRYGPAGRLSYVLACIEPTEERDGV